MMTTTMMTMMTMMKDIRERDMATMDIPVGKTEIMENTDGKITQEITDGITVTTFTKQFSSFMTEMLNILLE